MHYSQKVFFTTPATMSRMHIIWFFLLVGSVFFGGGCFRFLLLTGEWYASLNKADVEPAKLDFWAGMDFFFYAMMAISAWMVWVRGGFSNQSWPLSLFLGQLALKNAPLVARPPPPFLLVLKRPDLALLS